MGFDRESYIRDMIDGAGLGLEIGPSHSPIFPKRMGYKVETLDYANAETLRERYRGHPVNIDNIEEVDHVSDGRAIHEVVGKAQCYDYIFSSHAIEHVTDFVGYFQSCDMLLKPGGCAVLAIPDKRFIFDALRFPSSTGDVLEAWGRCDKRHSSARVFDFFSSYSTLASLHTWDADASGPVELQNDLTVARNWYEFAKHESEYVDVHAWTLTPASFKLIIRDLNELGLLNLKIAELHENGTFEFHVRLTREADLDTRDRIELVKDVHREQLVNSQQIVAADLQTAPAKEALQFDKPERMSKTFPERIIDAFRTQKKVRP